jgi:hypothetical protein
MAESVEGNSLLRRGRLLWLLLACPVVCTVWLCLFGGVYVFLLASVVQPFRAEMHHFAEGVLLGVYFGVPLGFASGVVGALLSGGLARGPLLEANRMRWLKVGSGIGATLGALAALCLAVASADVGPGRDLAIFALTAIAAGTSAGASVAWLAWREYGSSP